MPNPGQKTCPICKKRFTPTPGRGRPATYCGKQCRITARRIRRADSSARRAGSETTAAARPERSTTRADDGLQAAAVIDNLIGQLRGLRRSAYQHGTELSALQQYQALHRTQEILGAVLVEQARAGSASWGAIGAALQVSGDTARKRWPARQTNRLVTEGRQMRRRGPVPSAPAPAGRDAYRAPAPTSPPPSMPSAPPGSADGPQPLPAPGGAGAPPAFTSPLPPAHQLSAALSRMQRACGRSLRDLAKDAGVSSSYVSRLLAGERVPSWGVARSLAAACGAQPEELRPLWEAARTGTRPQRSRRTPQDQAAAALHDAVCDLYLAASRPAPYAICEQADGLLHTRDVTSLIEEGRLPDWPVLIRVITALDGHPDRLRPLWDQAHTTTPPQRSSLPASALG